MDVACQHLVSSHLGLAFVLFKEIFSKFVMFSGHPSVPLSSMVVYTGCFINSVTLLNCYQKFISNHI